MTHGCARSPTRWRATTATPSASRRSSSTPSTADRSTGCTEPSPSIRRSSPSRPRSAAPASGHAERAGRAARGEPPLDHLHDQVAGAYVPGPGPRHHGRRRAAWIPGDAIDLVATAGNDGLSDATDVYGPADLRRSLRRSTPRLGCDRYADRRPDLGERRRPVPPDHRSGCPIGRNSHLHARDGRCGWDPQRDPVHLPRWASCR